MNNILKKTGFFIYPYIVLLAYSIFLLLSFTKAEIHIWSNTHNSAFLDIFFKNITFFGNGFFVILIGLAMLFYRFRYSLMIFTTYAVSGLIAQILKRFIFPGILRPKIYFQGIYDLHIVKGVEVLSSNSFPSGHSASAFALFLCLASITRNNILKMLFLLIAVIVAYSRIYLSQHFFIDVVTGSFIGILVTFSYMFFENSLYKDWMETSLSSLINKRSTRTNRK
jgi:membrane-associated phospholipid phosphatase